MARIKLQANAELDLLNQAELDASLRHPDIAAGYWSARGRAVKYLEQSFTFQAGVISLAAGVVLCPPFGNGTPESGYAWALRLITVQTAAAVAVNVWKTADSTNLNAGAYIRGLGQDTVATKTVHSFPLSSLQGVLKAGEYVAVSGAAAGTITSAWFSAVEVPEAELWKVE